MATPLFTCVIPVKGNRPYFQEALASLESQGLGDELEIIVQDGDVEPDSGQSDALNKGFAKANGEWFFWLNADDVLLPGALFKVKELIRASTHPLNWIAGDTVYIDSKNLVVEVRADAKWRSWFGKRLSVWTGGPSAFFRRSLWERYGGLDVNLRYAMDIELWTRWAKAGEKFVGLGEYLWGFRMHEGSLTGNGRNAVGQEGELESIDARYGVSTTGFWRNVSRMASLFDGTWSKRRRDSRRLRGTVL